MCSSQSDEGFALVELMVVVLIIGILVTIAVPIFDQAATDARAKSCQSNQRVIISAIQVVDSMRGYAVSSTPGEFASGGSGWYGELVPEWVHNKPDCPTNHANYYISALGDITGDSGSSQAFKKGHQVWQ